MPPLVKRFYLQFALAPVLILSVVGNVTRIWPDGQFAAGLFLLVIIGFFLTIACRLFAESRGWGWARYLALSAGAIGLLALP